MNRTDTIEEFSSLFHLELKDHYPKEEIDAFVSISLSDLLGISKDEMRTKQSDVLKPEQIQKLHFVIQELKIHKPIQYIIGSTEFYGCKIKVNEHVLIPRQETEELIEYILQEIRIKGQESSKIRILDIGTGSGCIAIALKKKLSDAIVIAIDISENALLVAKENAILNHTEISFIQTDILNPLSTSAFIEQDQAFDIIVSNPPYIRASEKSTMSKNVLEHEPHLALFVEDNDPLLFYKAIADFAFKNLIPKGILYFEINEALGGDVKKMLEEKGFKNVEVKKDMSGKDRIIVAEDARQI